MRCYIYYVIIEATLLTTMYLLMLVTKTEMLTKSNTH